MSTKIVLPDGGWALLREPEAVPERLRRPVNAHAVALQDFVNADGEVTAMSPTVLAALEDMNDRLVVALVAEWSFDAPITLEAVLDLPGAVYDALRAAVTPLAVRMMPDFDPTPDPASPTSP